MKNPAPLQFLVPNRRNPEQFELCRDWEQMREGFFSESEGREREEQLIVTEERESVCSCLGIGKLRSRRGEEERLCIKAVFGLYTLRSLRS